MYVIDLTFKIKNFCSMLIITYLLKNEQNLF